MSQISVTIDGKQFRMACEDGQERHLEALAGDLDRRVQEMRAAFGEIGDLRLTVMAALTLGDELIEERRRAATLETREAALDRREAEIASAIDALTERVERIGKALGGRAGG